MNVDVWSARECGTLSSIVEAIGSTPLVELSRATKGLDGRVLAKLEYLNPGFSKKDRIAKQIVEEAERAGLLKPGDTIVELTSGNTGTGLAIVSGVKGYKFVAVMSRGNSAERATMMRALGADVVLVEQAPGSRPGEVSGADLALVEQAAQRITVERRAFRADQFTLAGNVNAHRLHTGPEILVQSGGRIDAFCDFVGSGGTLAGCAAAFKAHRQDIKCFAVEPEGAATLAGKLDTNANHPIQGGGYAFATLPLLDLSLLDDFIEVSGTEAIAAARHLARTEGMFAGPSSGANFVAARKLLETSMPGATIVIIACDSGLKYLSTGLWEYSGTWRANP